MESHAGAGKNNREVPLQPNREKSIFVNDLEIPCRRGRAVAAGAELGSAGESHAQTQATRAVRTNPSAAGKDAEHEPLPVHPLHVSGYGLSYGTASTPDDALISSPGPSGGQEQLEAGGDVARAERVQPHRLPPEDYDVEG